ncbi:ImmA/IrrE family metallo-endopeptidase [Bacillus inaquosorum]|uniref:ImmA/IrrE family metallo-endopeptidase n=1 Tax=Bacillus inaquosorum TaxID=483913 RepID=UPI00227F33DD|nr:ImmA/IrrE family metallo-endopeptidase [Bacillus inaquosorum]MCY7929789.1 ImmA/IrrE family metallo-endopeptidase [Bacillus inaquosorum]MCY8279996.1 ImmA/IrrE family metallo-endopeptidase [Bacillus inaquosorum]MCY8723081.1 ImmA/IrrE family metallo-endopeptidase [Bacillus inaquosorum]MCY8768987.1 ImmA/IrrE family metallo-endopeptidase [Bacillus inaquosorum]MCY9384152.1 ImmA/IrrE family metallo-endopeptidase [Bacillus inaquosorum]
MIIIYTSKSIKHRTQSVINKYGTNDVYEICELLNIYILKNNLGQAKGFLQFDKPTNQYLIHINENLNNEQFVIAHELGHYFLHKNLNTFKIQKCSSVLKDKLEHQANLFAAELLLTDKMIRDALPIIREFNQEQMASYFKVPLSVVTDYKFSHPGNTLNNIFNFYNNQLKAFG